MARANRSAARAASSEPRMSSGKCNCNLGWMVLAWILVAIGVWALVAGFATQFNSSVPTALNVEILGWYFAGVLVVSLGKMAKWKSCGSCNMHGHMGK